MEDIRIDEQEYRLAKFCRALSNAVRLKLVLLLRDDSSYVSELARELKKSRSTISRHLSKLADHDLVQSKSAGRKNIYRLKRPELIDKFLEIRPLLERD
jgi:DNA-binding transcriptional ArsR family regulator